MATPEPAALGASKREEFLARGFCKWEGMLAPEEVASLRDIYDGFLAGEFEGIDKHRYDLGAGEARKSDKTENITQIMWPSDVLPELRDHTMRKRAHEFVASLYPEDDPADWIFDFDMLIAKAPFTNTATPAHQDQAYWLDLPDKRAVSIWISLDEATVDNGCMWYAPGSHLLPLRPHRRAGADANSALQCDADESEMEPVPMQPGDSGLHAGRCLHYSRGNTTASHRRAYILNFRPKAMVEYERAHLYDHGRSGHKSHSVHTKE